MIHLKLPIHTAIGFSWVIQTIKSKALESGIAIFIQFPSQQYD